VKRIAIFASGSGTNAERIIKHFGANGKAKVVMVVSNKMTTGVVERAINHDVPAIVLAKSSFFAQPQFIQFLKKEVDIIVLAGFLLKIPAELVAAFSGKIINIHPALLPKHGGKGMYGKHVHKAVIDANEKQSGITIHYVNEEFDEGKIIFQAQCTVDQTETPQSLAQKIHELEYQHFPAVIEKLIS
jgi:phosphoribosylglycinamide formyltransferase 1